MTKRFLVFLFLIVSLAFVVEPRGLRAEIIDQIVAIVNDDTITYSEMRKVLNPIYSQYQKAYQGEELLNKMIKAKNEVLNQLIENKLLAAEARKRDLEINPKEIDEHIDRIKSRFASSDEFERVMAAEGMSVELLRKSVEEQYLIRALVQRELAPRAVVGPGEVEAYYKENSANFREEEMVQASHILVKKTVPPPEGSPEAADKAFEKITQAAAEIKKGVDFETVAKKYSEAPEASAGGDLGFFSHGKMIKEIEDVAFRLSVGQTSEIIKTSLGYHLVFVKAKRADRIVPLPEVQKQIEQELFQKKTEALRKKLVEELRQKAYVKVLE